MSTSKADPEEIDYIPYWQVPEEPKVRVCTKKEAALLAGGYAYAKNQRRRNRCETYLGQFTITLQEYKRRMEAWGYSPGCEPSGPASIGASTP